MPDPNADATLVWKTRLSTILRELGSPNDSDYRDGFMHMADVAMQNEDLIGLDLLSNALGTATDNVLPAEIQESLQKLFIEAMAVGKEFTLRKLCKMMDPHGEWIDVPKDWIGKGSG